MFRCWSYTVRNIFFRHEIEMKYIYIELCMGHEWDELPIIFTSDEVTNENHWRIASRVTQSSLFMVTNVLFYFLHDSLCPERTIFHSNQLSIADFAIVARDGPFWLSIVTSLQLICDVTRTWGTGIMTSYSAIVLARATWRKIDLY